MPERLNATHRSIQRMCRRIGRCTGARLRYTPLDYRNRRTRSELLRENRQCRWCEEVHQSGRVVGFLHVDEPQDSSDEPQRNDGSELARVLQQAELGQMVADLLNRSLESRAGTRGLDTQLAHNLADGALTRVEGMLSGIVRSGQFWRVEVLLCDEEGDAIFELTRYPQSQEARPGNGGLRKTTGLERSILEGGWRVVSCNLGNESLPRGASVGVGCAIEVESRVIGILWAFDRRARTVGLRDRRMLMRVAGEIGRELKERVLMRSLAEHQRKVTEIQVAMQALPAERIEGSIGDGCGTYAGICVSQDEMGGDLLEWITLENGDVVFAVGDAAGHSLPAALVMATARGAIRGGAFRSVGLDVSPGALMAAANVALCGVSRSYQFMTAVCGVIDCRRGLLRYSSAGHPAGWLIRKGKEEPLESRGLLLGVMENGEFTEHVLELSTGDRLMFLTDGVAEARRADSEMYGIERCVAGLREGTGNAGDILKEIESRWWLHIGSQTVEDDTTLLVVEWH